MRRAQRRPGVTEIYQRYQDLTDPEGQPKWLEAHDQIYHEGANGSPQIRPEQCRGLEAPSRMCHRHNFCAVCHEWRTKREAEKVALTHLGRPNIYRISVDLDNHGGRHPMHAKDAMRRVGRALRHHGFDRMNLYLHPFRQNPFEGPHAHIEGVVSGLDPDPDIFDRQVKGSLAFVLRKFMSDGDGAEPTEIRVERLHPYSRKHVHQLIEHGMEVGRPSFPVRRILAGLYQDHKDNWRTHFTDVHEKSLFTHIRTIECRSKDHLPDADAGEILTAAVMAETWRESVERPTATRHVKISAELLDVYLEAAPRRDEWAMPREDLLRDEWEEPVQTSTTLSRPATPPSTPAA